MSAHDYDRGHEDGWYAAGKLIREYRAENEQLRQELEVVTEQRDRLLTTAGFEADKAEVERLRVDLHGRIADVSFLNREVERLRARVMDLELEIGHCSKRKCPTQKALHE